MTRRRPSINTDPTLSRKRTADLLRQLRQAGKDARVLKARIATAERDETPPRVRAAGRKRRA